MSDIVERLEYAVEHGMIAAVHTGRHVSYEEARDEIVRLRAEVHFVNKALDLTARKIIKVEAERDRLREALTPSAETKAAYMGEFSIQVTDAYEDDDGEFAEYIRRVLIPWDAIKEIMAAIRARAALKGDK